LSPKCQAFIPDFNELCMSAIRPPADNDEKIRVAFRLSQQGQPREALAILQGILATEPGHLDALNLSGVVAGMAGDPQRAIPLFDAAIARRYDFADAHCNRAFALLLMGDYPRGWPEYEWRWQLGGRSADRARPGPHATLWLGGTPLRGKSILLRAEQGLGDCLQFCRYALPLAARGARVILEVPAPLVTLLADLDGVAQIVKTGSTLPAFDYYCPLMSLPLALGTTLQCIPHPDAYLRSDAMKVAEWRTRLGACSHPRIGLAWSGSATNQNDACRSLSLAVLMRHLPREFEYVSLQKSVRAADAETLGTMPALRHFGDELYDFSDTAALCQCMDGVVSVDTSVAHLSAALGIRTRILLARSPNWRWLLDRSDSPWYSAVRLYRQEVHAQWGGVLEQVARDLRAMPVSGQQPAMVQPVIAELR
jgi:hypothetical protein